jgi:RsiW-degrading membrane proteinase PrsW (M82 family)
MVSYKIILIAAAIGIIPIFGWFYFLLHRRGSIYADPNFLLKIFFWGVMTAIPASILQIVVTETGSDKVLAQKAQEVWSSGGSTFLAAFVPVALMALFEEVSKGAGILIATKRGKLLRRPNSGLIAGLIVGLAFGVTENGVYFANAIDRLSGQGGLLEIVILRFVLSTSSHLIYSAIVGIGIAWAFNRSFSTWNSIKYALGGLFLATLVHALFNFFLGTEESRVVIFIVLWGFVTLGLYYQKNEQDWKAEHARISPPSRKTSSEEKSPSPWE